MVNHKGSKYEAGRDVKTIAQLVRSDIKAAIKSGALPAGLKTRVKIDRFSMGCSLDVIVTDGVDGCFNPEFWKHLNDPRASGPRPNRYTAEGKALIAKLEAICKAYQHEDSDSMSDYMNTNFYLSVKFDSDLERASVAAA